MKRIPLMKTLTAFLLTFVMTVTSVIPQLTFHAYAAEEIASEEAEATFSEERMTAPEEEAEEPYAAAEESMENDGSDPAEEPEAAGEEMEDQDIEGSFEDVEAEERDPADSFDDEPEEYAEEPDRLTDSAPVSLLGGRAAAEREGPVG
ncbi:MAG: hypothetical protein J6Y57_11820 [Lachnospiraceae bacterium]|nr:hypothetical protein [Lachnospiraceae bacterium]